jgi:hypothetical protein
MDQRGSQEREVERASPEHQVRQEIRERKVTLECQDVWECQEKRD